MGGNQSRASDDESSPRYNYHERVLKDAVAGFVSCDPNSALFVPEDEQYFSTEEGDGSVGSITPERTRPESSSGESSSNDSGSDEDNSEEGGSRHEGGTVAFRIQASANSDATRTVTPVNSDISRTILHASRRQDTHTVHNNSEPFSERSDSENIGGSSNIISESGSGSRLNRSPGLNDRNDTVPKVAEDRLASVVNSSQDVPVQQSNNSTLKTTASDKKEVAATLGKRKKFLVSESSPEESMVPRKLMLTRNSTKRKRLGYPDSSESEDSERSEEGWKQYKKGRMGVKSAKKSRRRDHGSRERDSDEKRYGQQRRTRRSRYDNDSDDSGKFVGCSRESGSASSKRKNYGSDESSDFSDRTSRGRKRRRPLRHWRRESDSEEEEEKSEVVQRKVSKCVNCGCGEVITVQQPQNHPPNELREASETVTLTVHSASKEANLSAHPCHTCKMGDQSLRNLHGKVLPVRQLNQSSSTSEALLDTSAINQSNTPDQAGNLSKLRNLETVNSTPLPSKINISQKPNLSLDDSSLSNNLKEIQQRNEATQSTQEGIHESPFKNVVLSPPTINSLDNSGPFFAKGVKRASNDSLGEEGSDMEVEEIDTVMGTETTNSPCLNSSSPSTKVILQGRRRVKTVASQFKSFWLKKKKTISQNLKSLWSNVGSPPGRPLTFDNHTWPTYASSPESAQGFSPQNDLRSSQMTPLTPNNWQWSPQASSRSFTQLQQSWSSPAREISPQGSSSGSSPGASSAQLNQARSPVQNLRSGVGESQLVSPIEPKTQSSIVMPPDNGHKQQRQGTIEWHPQTVQYQVLNCCFANVVHLTISTGDLANQKTAAIVNWTDGALMHTVTVCSKSIAAKAGALMRAACNDYIQSKGSNLEAPDVLITPAGGKFERAVEAILHVVSPQLVAERDEEGSRRALMEVYANCLRFASERLGLDSISFPLVGEGLFPFDMCVQCFHDALLVFLKERMSSKISDLFHVHLIIPDMPSANFAADLINSLLKQICQGSLKDFAESMYSRYYHQQEASETLLSDDDERSPSGRPRLKRPRL